MADPEICRDDDPPQNATPAHQKVFHEKLKADAKQNKTVSIINYPPIWNATT